MIAKPTTHIERTMCISALAPLFSAAPEHEISALVMSELKAKYLPVQAKYRAAILHYKLKKESERVVRDAAARADRRHDVDLGNWRNTVLGKNGKILSTALSDVFGLSASELSKLPYRKQLAATEGIRELLALSPHLAGDPEKFERFMKSRARLERLVARLESAERARTNAKSALEAVAAQLDAAFQDAAALLKQVHPAIAATILPDFSGSKKKKGTQSKKKAEKPAEAPPAPSPSKVCAAPSPPAEETDLETDLADLDQEELDEDKDIDDLPELGDDDIEVPTAADSEDDETIEPAAPEPPKASEIKAA